MFVTTRRHSEFNLLTALSCCACPDRFHLLLFLYLSPMSTSAVAFRNIIRKAKVELSGCEGRLAVLEEQGKEYARIRLQEDQMQASIQAWCLRVQSTVLVPTTKKIAQDSAPRPSGEMSPAILKLFRDAESSGIAKMPDIPHVANLFKAIGWSCLAATTFSKKPTVKEMRLLVKEYSNLDFRDDKAFRMMKATLQKTHSWQQKVRKLLAPKPGEKSPFSVQMATELKESASDLPLDVSEVFLLDNTIEDKGIRHCLCGGPNDGTFMLSCDKCANWFHGRCVNVTQEASEGLDYWACPKCAGTKACTEKFNAIEWDGEMQDAEDDYDDTDGSKATANKGKHRTAVVPNAPDPLKSWPPFGLLGSQESIDALGADFVAQNLPTGQNTNPSHSLTGDTTNRNPAASQGMAQPRTTNMIPTGGTIGAIANNTASVVVLQQQQQQQQQQPPAPPRTVGPVTAQIRLSSLSSLANGGLTPVPPTGRPIAVTTPSAVVSPDLRTAVVSVQPRIGSAPLAGQTNSQPVPPPTAPSSAPVAIPPRPSQFTVSHRPPQSVSSLPTTVSTMMEVTNVSKPRHAGGAVAATNKTTPVPNVGTDVRQTSVPAVVRNTGSSQLAQVEKQTAPTPKIIPPASGVVTEAVTKEATVVASLVQG